MTPSEALKVMGISAGSSQEDLKKRFHALAHLHHPDKGGNGEIFKKVSQAYQVLKSGIPAGNTSSGFGNFNPKGFQQATSFDWETEEPVYDPPVTKRPPERTEYKPPAGPNAFGFTDSQGHFVRKTASQRMSDMQRQQQAYGEQMYRQQKEFEEVFNRIKREFEKRQEDLNKDMEQRAEDIKRAWGK